MNEKEYCGGVSCERTVLLIKLMLFVVSVRLGHLLLNYNHNISINSNKF